MKRTRAILGLAAASAVLLLSGCAAEANRAGAIVTISPVADFLSGLLQGAFILIVAVINVVGIFIGFSTDVYQSGKSAWYVAGFLVGLLVAIAGPFSFLRLFTRRRAE